VNRGTARNVWAFDRGWNPRTKANAPLLQLQTFSPFHTFTSKQFRSTDSVPSQPTIETRIVEAGELHITYSPRIPPSARRLTRATNSQATRRFARAPKQHDVLRVLQTHKQHDASRVPPKQHDILRVLQTHKQHDASRVPPKQHDILRVP
jgi:hypothetical protein